MKKAREHQPMTINTPELAAACQLLYSVADSATTQGREALFHAIAHLTGKPISHVERTWNATR